jgi:uncharacterized protein YaiE (UPF0345 family)
MKFEQVNVVKKANVYFDGKVTSRTILFQNGEKKTLGFMLAGEYEFNTVAQELMEILGGEIEVMVKGDTSYTSYQENESFVVPANSSFKMIVKTYTDYCCSYQE